MKFLHLSDLHVGKSLGDFDLLDDQRIILNQILTVCRERGVDALLIAGDVYDKSIPPEGAVALFDAFIRDAVGQGLKIFLITGNHDSDERLNFGSSLFRESGVFMAAKYDGSLPCETFTDEFGPVRVWMLPFVKASQVKHFCPDAAIESYDDAVRTVIAGAHVNGDERNIILSHQFVVSGSGVPALGGSENLSVRKTAEELEKDRDDVRSVGTVEQIYADVFDPFDYAALGHIHAPQAVGREEVRYAGSPLKYSASEADRDKSAPLVTLGKKGDVTIEYVPLVPRRDVRCLKGPLMQLLENAPEEGREDYIFAVLTDDDVVNDAMGVIRRVYPNTVQVRYDNSFTKELMEGDLTAPAEERSFEQLIRDFYASIYPQDISDEEMKIMREVAGKAGVL